VLVLGSGGVAIFALQFAKRLGANVVAITSSEAKVDMLRSLGADVVINYAHKPDWQQQVLSMTNGIGVDRVIETGGAGTLERSLMSTAAHGRVILIGVLSGPARIDPAPILLKRIELIGISTGSRDMFEQMNRAIGQWQLHPVINHTFDFEDAKSAYDYLAGGNHIGKVIIAV
jgi:NADPH:quinone reductase-like Zn-dependent oxidoreductase